MWCDEKPADAALCIFMRIPLLSTKRTVVLLLNCDETGSVSGSENPVKSSCSGNKESYIPISFMGCRCVMWYMLSSHNIKIRSVCSIQD
jgi:hypothetical protein